MGTKFRPTILGLFAELILLCAILALVVLLNSDGEPSPDDRLSLADMEFGNLLLDADGSVDWFLCGIIAVIFLYCGYRVVTRLFGSVTIDGDFLIVRKLASERILLKDIGVVCMRDTRFDRETSASELMSLVGLGRLAHALGLGYLLVILKDGEEIWLPGYRSSAAEAINEAIGE